MKKRWMFWILGAAAVLLAASSPAADLQLFQNLPLDQPPVDVTVSRSGTWVYVLSDDGTLFVYHSQSGEMIDRVAVDPETDRIEAGLRDDLLYLSSRSGGSVQMVRIDLVHDIPTAGAPFKGPADAPVTVVVFTDFQ